MPIRQIQPHFSQMMQDYFGEGGMFPSLWQGTPSYGIQPEGEYYNPDPQAFLEAWELEPYERWGYEGLARRHPSGWSSDYPRHKERAEVTDFLFAQEESRASVKSERFKLDDLLADIQVTGPDSLKVGGVSKDLEHQRGVINQGLIDLDEKRQLESQMQELTFLQNIFNQRQDYERQVGNDYLAWLSTQPHIVDDPEIIDDFWNPNEVEIPDEDEYGLGDDWDCLNNPGCCNDAGEWICETGGGEEEDYTYDDPLNCPPGFEWSTEHQWCVEEGSGPSGGVDCGGGWIYDYDLGECVEAPETPDPCPDPDACNTGYPGDCVYPDPDTGDCPPYPNPFND